MSELRTTNLRHGGWGGDDPNIRLYNDGSTSINNLQNNAKSLVINGAMEIVQRGSAVATGISQGGYYGPDRMRITFTSDADLRLSCSRSTTNPGNGFARSYLVEVTTVSAGGAGSGFRPLEYRIEGLDVQQLAWGTANAKPLSVSFWVRCSVAGHYSMGLIRSIGTDRNIGTTFEITAAEAAANTWKQITHTFPGDTGGGQAQNDTAARLRFYIFGGAGSDLRSVDNTAWGNFTSTRLAFGQTAAMHTTLNSQIYITGLVLTPTAAPVTEFPHESFGETLLKCYRYTYAISTAEQYNTNHIAEISNTREDGTTRYAEIVFPVRMRGVPDNTAALINLRNNAPANVSAETVYLSRIKYVYTCTSTQGNTAQFIRLDNTTLPAIFQAEI